ncbi:MAG TPA: helix-hairpin-helix domain-containing protein [Terriglobia bacterium]|nr:helix-hairpin-helix domain-containing protein [Terriglobia bacterium]
MPLYCRTIVSAFLLAVFVLSLSACSSRSRAQNQATQDEQTRERVADATEKAKQESQKAAQQVDAAAQEAEHEAKVAAEGVKEGWNRDQGRKVDLNAATETQLRRLPGLSDSEVRRMLNGRPYKTKEELVTRGILSQEEYNQIQDQLTVQGPAAREK